MNMDTGPARAFRGALLLAFCAVAALAASPARWYTPGQMERGLTIYAENCAVCHGKSGEGQPNWDQPDEMGFYPAPPLNPTGHAWHHPLADMLQTLELGGGPSGGTMPSFSGILDDDAKRAVIAYVQSLWPDDMYESWAAIDRGEAKPPPMPGHEH